MYAAAARAVLFTGLPCSGAVCGYAALHRARAGGAPLQLQACAVVQMRGCRRGLRRRPRLFSGPPCKQIECENGGGFCLQERVEGSVEWCEGRK